MSFEILERFVEGKHDDRQCEDVVVATDDFVAVIDGASDETGARFAGKSGGKFAADAVAHAIRHLPASAGARVFADALALAVRTEVVAQAGALGADARWPTASVICCSAQRRESWRIGDCNLVINGQQHLGRKRVDDAAYGSEPR